MRHSKLIFAPILLLCSVSAFAQRTSHSTRANAAPVKQYTIEQFMDTTRIGGSSFSPDEKSILFHSNKSGIFNVYTVPVTGGDAEQLTNSTKESTYAVSYLPTDTRVIYTYDRGGNENSHLYLREADGSERDLTPGDKVKASFIGWTRDRMSFFYSTNERDPRYFDIFEMTVPEFKSTLLYKNETGLDVGDISNDHKFLAFQKSGGSPADSDVYLYNVQTKELKNITEHTGDVANSPLEFDPDSKSLYFLTDEGSEFQYIARYDLATGKHEAVEKAPWDITSMGFSRNGKYRIVNINEDAHTKIKIYNTATGKLVPLPKLPNADITGVSFSPSEKLMAFYVNGDRSPSNLYVYNFATGKATKLTSSLNPEINPNDLVDTQVVRYKSFDGMVIPNILFKPKQADAMHKAPALLLIHGGPGGQTRAGYSALGQYLANHGYVILGVNNRGSSGYGKTFFTSDDGKHGREPLWDCIEAKKYLQSLGYVDENKIGILGGSYGGYMVLAALAFKPTEFAVGVDLFGVSNWVRTLQSIPPYWESIRKSLYKEIGDPSKDLDNLRAVSPLFHADNIVKPLIVLQGANDPRVIKPESDEIVDNIKKRNGVVEYVVFDNEGHGFTKKANEIRAYKAILDFVDKYLK
ncbi:MAG TPA: prolyl oligopeptidase family serine peptidase [Pyrinomonadaceae bacterium]|nr:prolyl oligopeptidase family serine peptidase [Pyrinomonadaceae bacterium]